MALRLWIIIPVYGNWEDAAECLAALEAQTCTDFRVLVADDGSPTPPPACIRRSPLAGYLRCEHRGFAENCNRAARAAMAGGATHLLFLNSDTTFPATFVERWRSAVAGMPGAILSPLIYWSERRSEVWFSGGKMSIWIPFLRQKRQFLSTTEVDIVTGCALLVPASEWRSLGGFDPKYVTYYEDFDFTLRARAHGIPIYVVPDPGLSVWHRVSGSYRGTPRWWQQYRMVTSSLIFIRAHYQGLSRWTCLVLKCAHMSFIGACLLPEIPRWKLLRKAVADGMRQPV